MENIGRAQYRNSRSNPARSAASALEQPYEAWPQRLLNPLKILFGDGLNAMEFHPLGLGTEQAIGHTTVKVDMRVQ
jgi:hypothetical protein